MKKVINRILFSFLLLILSSSFSAVQAQDNPKVDKAMSQLCESSNVFIASLIILDEANNSGDLAAINTAYNKAVKDWDKVEKAAAKVEKVEIKESVKAYNKLVDSVNKMSKDGFTDEESDQLNDYIDDTADEINAILSTFCQ